MVKFKKNYNKNFGGFKANLTFKIKVKVASFLTCPRLYVINTWFKFEDKIQNTSKVIVFTRNHTDNDDVDDRTKKMSYLSRGGHNELQ